LTTLFVNFSGKGNVGDDLLLYSAVSLSHQGSFYAFNGSSFYRSEILNKLAVNSLSCLFVESKIDLLKLFSSKRINRVIIAGGQVFQDFKNPINSMPAIIFFVVLLANFFKVPVEIRRVGVSALTSGYSKFVIKNVLRMSDIISVRDKYSQLVVKKLIGTNVEIEEDFVLANFYRDKVVHFSKVKNINIAVCLADGLVPFFFKVLKEKHRLDYFKMVVTDNLGEGADLLCLDKDEIFGRISTYNTVITNRLHFAILSRLSGVENIIILNRDTNKLKAFSDKYDYKNVDYDAMYETLNIDEFN
jgi:hypothetical protein